MRVFRFMYYNRSIHRREDTAMDYKTAIIEMVHEVQNDRILRFLYHFLLRVLPGEPKAER